MNEDEFAQGFTVWREGFSEWAVRSASDSAKWFGELAANTTRDPQSVAIGLVIALAVAAVAVVILHAIWVRVWAKVTASLAAAKQAIRVRVFRRSAKNDLDNEALNR